VRRGPQRADPCGGRRARRASSRSAISR
jgi:hypothetical protein